MAYFRAAIGGGGGETETILWENESPSSNFAAQEVTLSQAYTNFSKLRFYFVYRTTILSPVMWVEYNVQDIVDNWRLGTGTAGTNVYKMHGSFALVAANNIYSRYFAKDANNTPTIIRFWIAYRLSDASQTGAYLVPTKITGIN